MAGVYQIGLLLRMKLLFKFELFLKIFETIFLFDRSYGTYDKILKGKID